MKSYEIFFHKNLIETNLLNLKVVFSLFDNAFVFFVVAVYTNEFVTLAQIQHII